MRRILVGVEHLFMGVGILLLAAMFVVVCLQIVSRFVIQSPIPWTEEVGRYLFGWASFLGAAVLVGRGEHFSIDFIAQALPPRGRRVLRLGVTILVVGFALVMVIYGYRVSRRLLTASSPILQLSLGIVYGIIPVSGLYMLLHGLMGLTCLIRGEEPEGGV